MLFLRPLGENILRYESVCVCVDLARKNGALYILDKALTLGVGHKDIVEINLCHCFRSCSRRSSPVKHN